MLLHQKSRNKAPWVSASVEDLALRLGGAITSTSSRPLWEAFANTKGNPSADVVKAFLANLGVKKPAEKIDTKAGSPRWQHICGSLGIFIEVRNECAHTGQIVASPDVSTVKGYCDLLEETATLVVKVLEDHISSL